eukprot:TRINITY_DN3056_c0_g1_i16.p1 TRINITY_DN3056_c0_g1~~TRINITY_DN3056_c0_g1_i16.p1  ORF type:complete len:159 (-),score=11.90 TRINITY_DN3056_c0_g1_i16:66-542(-)
MIRRPPRSTLSSSSAASDVYKRQLSYLYTMKLLKRPIINVVNNHLIDYPTPINFNYWYNFGLLSAVCLGIQILTGIFLAMHYTPHIDYAWLSVEHIMRDVNYGWLIRYMHANGASMFFIVVYVHLSLIHISEPTRLLSISYAVFCLKKKKKKNKKKIM